MYKTVKQFACKLGFNWFKNINIHFLESTEHKYFLKNFGNHSKYSLMSSTQEVHQLYCGQTVDSYTLYTSF